jgi:response regulator RpfG family c-di-GMP phosphodiesterase
MEPNKRWNLLVIDSNHDAVNYLQNLLEGSPYNIISTDDGEDGFSLLLNRPEQFSAIILGQNIRNINSVRLLHKINSCSSLKTIPVIMEAATGTLEEMEICIRAGVRYFIPKPIDKNTLPELINTAIRDQERYTEIEQLVFTSKPLNTMVEAKFKIKNLYDVQLLSALLANECPSPRLAAVGISEILINAIEHGNLGITYAEKTKLHETSEWLAEIERRLALPENHDKYVDVNFNKTNGRIIIRIKDQGQGFDWRQFQTLDSKRVFDNHGRGIIMARNLAFEDLIFHGVGNDVECIIPLAI